MAGGAAAGAPLADLLRRLRVSAGLSQEALAERAGLSARGVSDLERGLRRVPHPTTLARLADALEVSPAERSVLLAARSASTHVPVEQPAEAPPVRPAQPMSRELSSFVGRQHELGALTRLLHNSGLVTLAGPGGAGKTRLALRLAQSAEDAVLVDLAPLADPRLVPRAVALSTGVVQRPHQPLVDSLVEVLRERSMLLVLDNCEHLVSACAELVDALLRACPLLRVIATSREPIGVEGEAVFRVPPLRLPLEANLSACAESEAVQLFVQRASSARHDFVLDVVSAPLIARVCRRLAGLPLAIELAAARVATLSLGDRANRLETSSRLLSGGQRRAPPRQRTMHAAIAWSYWLLSEDERRMFDCLSIHAGSFHLDQVQAVCASTEPDTVDRLGRLVSTSMVQAEPLQGGSLRYRLLEPLRDFGLERLNARGEHDELSRRHALGIRALIEGVQDGVGESLDGGPRQLEWFRRLDQDWDNIRAALDWADRAGDAETALRITAPLWMYLSRPNLPAEGRARLERVVQLPNAEAYPGPRGRVLGVLCMLAGVQADQAAATAFLGQARALLRTHPDAWLDAYLLQLAAHAQMFTGDTAAAERRVAEAHERAERVGSRVVAALARFDLASLATARGDGASAEALLRTTLRVAEANQDVWMEAMALNALGDLLRGHGDMDAAADAYQRALPTLRTMNGDLAPPGMLHNLAYVALARKDARGALELFLQSADGYRVQGADRRGIAECVIGLGIVCLELNRPELGAQLFGSADAALEQLGTSITPSNTADYARGRARLAAALLPAEQSRLEARGRDLRLEQAVHLARSASGGHDTEGPASELTPRELEVAELLVRGLRNRQIAQTLVITEKTAANHVQRVLDKLDVQSRAEVAARAAELGLTRSVSS
jgi:non-specific serine/threonine protein kinase